jgi:GPR1/FUN34/yaaH family
VVNIHITFQTLNLYHRTTLRRGSIINKFTSSPNIVHISNFSIESPAMATTGTDINGVNNGIGHGSPDSFNKEAGSNHFDHATNGANGATNTSALSNQQAAAMGYGPYGGNPLGRIQTNESARLPAFGGEFQPGLYRETKGRKFGNPAPLGLSAFALTTFILSIINMQARGVTVNNIVVSAAYAYGGLVQLLAGMWYVTLHSV